MTRREWNPFLRFPRASLLVAAVLCLPLLWPLARFAVSAEVTALLQGDRRNLAAYTLVREILGNNEVVVISLEHPDLFSPAGLEVVWRLSDALERLPGVVEVKSLTHAVKPVRRGLGFEMEPLLPEPPLDAAKLAALREFCLGHPLVRNIMVAADGRHTVLTATFAGRPESPAEQAAFRDRLQAALAPFRAADVPLRVLALPLIEAEIRASLVRDLRRFVPAALAVTVVVLWGAFRSFRLVAFTLASQAAVLTLLPGVIQWSGRTLTVFSAMLLPLNTGLHLTLLVHLLTAWQRARALDPDPAAALRAALADVWKPALFSVLTTIIGLLSLTTGGEPQMRDFGWLGAACLVVVWAFTFGPVLVFLQGTGHVSAALGPRVREPNAGTVADRWVKWLARHRRGVFIAAALAALVAVIGLAQTRTDVRMTGMLSPASPTRQALEELDARYGGLNVVQIEFDTGTTNGVNAPAFLHYLERVQRFAASRPEPTGVYSYAQLLAMVNQVWEGGRADALRLPENPLLLGLFTTALRSYELPFLTALADPAFRTASLVVRTRHLPAGDYLELVRAIVAEADRTRPPGVTVSAARGLHDILEADRRLLRSQAGSAGVAAGLIALTLGALWRSPRLAVLALVTNLVPVALALAGAGFAGVPLNSITVMVGAIALGVAVDDTVHFLTHWQETRRRGLSPVDAVRETLRVKGPPIFWTTVILVAVFALFLLSSFPPVVQFGLLLAGAFAAAQIAVLALLPAWLVGVR